MVALRFLFTTTLDLVILKEPEISMGTFGKNLLWAVLTFILIALLFSNLINFASEKTPVFALDVLASKINEAQVKSIAVSGNTLQIVLQDGIKAVSRKENESGLTETLKNYGVSPEALRAVELSVKDESGLKFWLGVLIPALLPIIVIVLIFWWILRQAKTGVNQAFTFGKANLKLFTASQRRYTFKDAAGLKEAKEELEEVVDFLKNPKKFLSIGARIPRGVLLMGLPGTGKTLLARAVAGESNVPFFHISASEFVEMFVGVGASRVRDLFQTAKKTAPSIVFIDEIDAVGRERGAGLGGGHDEREQTLNQILVEMDGFERDTNVIVMAATNRPDVLDPALLRPGRFDRRVILDMPDINDREAILKIHAREMPLDKSVDLRVVAVRTPGFSGADLANLVNEAAILTARQNRKIVIQNDLLDSIEKIILGPERKSRVISKKEKEITAYHEAGHALVTASLKDADPVHKVSVVSRGIAGGYTLKLPTEERRLKTKAQFLADLAVAFGGYAAEMLKFRDLSTGSSNDIKQATMLAHKMVTQFGMSDKLGPRTFGKTQELIFLGREISTEKDYSEKIASVIDEEVNSLINKAHSFAKKIVSTKGKILEAIAKALMEKETLEQEEFYKIVKSYNLKPIAIR
ncbi:MAG: ATP-dependent zinc metalloprotease FtsH [Candidatus Jorgensenbacteria bacterium GW2011_GWA1_48_13]|uniref:ATP-dependent zinc metalloprotease FtsH n=2 Tax=Candidatus Joergenseniibacteriota TaxID=1752739 RepID=A0A0G1W8Y7_9BACT|nr:MAG: ATP-dependent zinc metalloprotease FtsH [Candidatus Jorgensenbacteria bacterium GW2011_GWA1_48_13]KKW15251.1 MAG: ATP-dependent zinc metalloprotease FtsH [Candidatus Jorgensenbacteria bacterium GW2011_GWB1_50_10]